ncbi:uncharacterized protein ACA1_136090 [Acanthamoeba castellanii str. Neff]|uniref:DUF541 domain-containing protein n=1 Tax=Acanthamoeba castellanii (strain ATCC 30010 / Neff) TaxID=1257118 RepID=L8GEU2_ACACF|nr:uncharacterized protein ACA1_136090 [Acanthamoeba castellanii str. Neff]ELR11399.1 hypothetical protein ACA1_136090 [Acanthamoeba castellanii str. Neff]
MKAQALLAACLLATFFCFLCSPATAQDINATSNVVKATGTGKVTIEAGVAQVELGVQVDAPNASQAQAQAANSAQAIVSTLQGLNVSKLQTSSVSLMQINFPTPSPSPIPLDSSSAASGGGQSEDDIVFRASNTVSFEVAADQAGAAIDAAVGAGANTIRSVSLVPSEAAVTAAQQQATRLAVANAIAYGRLILGELGCQAVGVGAVTLTPLYAPMSSSVRTAGVTADSATTPVLSGEVDISATVEVNLLQSCPGSAIDAINNANTNATAAT